MITFKYHIQLIIFKGKYVQCQHKDPQFFNQKAIWIDIDQLVAGYFFHKKLKDPCYSELIMQLHHQLAFYQLSGREGKY